MDFGAYVRVTHGIQYRQITGLYDLSDGRVVAPTEPNAVYACLI